jgi:hypothetical protein
MPTLVAWNLEELRSKVRAKYGDRSTILDTVASLARSDEIFRYHLAAARDALRGFVDESNVDDSEALLYLLGGHERQGDFRQAKIASEAHLIACMHTARGIWDIFAQLVNALAVPKPLAVGSCDIKAVKDALPDSPLKASIQSNLDSHWYRYVAAFINTTKHRRLVHHNATVSFAEGRAGIRVGDFRYGAHSFPTYWGNEVLEGVLVVKNHIIESGSMLNATL